MADLFLPDCLTTGPFFGKQVPFLHYGRPVRPIRWGKRNRGFVSTVFTDSGPPTDGGSLASGDTGYGDPAIIEGPGPLYGNDDNTPSTGGLDTRAEA